MWEGMLKKDDRKKKKSGKGPGFAFPRAEHALNATLKKGSRGSLTASLRK